MPSDALILPQCFLPQQETLDKDQPRRAFNDRVELRAARAHGLVPASEFGKP